jgi:hypothetical protein
MTVREGGDEGVAYSLKLPAGNYEFYDCFLFTQSGEVEVRAMPKEHFSIPFTVEPGRVVYVGEFRLTGLMGKTPRGYPIPAGGYYQVRDRRVRDIAILSSLNPGIDWSQSTSRVLNPPASAAPLFRAGG